MKNVPTAALAFLLSVSYAAAQNIPVWQLSNSGTVGSVKLRVSPLTTSDFYVVLGIHRQAAIRIRKMRVSEGSGWNTVPLTGANGSPASVKPSGAQEFKVDPPENKTGRDCEIRYKELEISGQIWKLTE